jgi:hypothetical protein
MFEITNSGYVISNGLRKEAGINERETGATAGSCYNAEQMQGHSSLPVG